MTKSGILITGLKTQRIQSTDYAEYHRLGVAPEFALPCEDKIIESCEPMPIHREIVPMNRICKAGRPDLYVAYSREIEDLLGVPINAIVEASEAIEKENSRLVAFEVRVKKMGIFKRIKAVFTGIR